MIGSVYPLTALESVTGLMMGLDAGSARLDSLKPWRPEPRAALDAVILDAFSAGDVFVSFSGGRDSSAILAIAAEVARRHSLSPPIALTLRVRGSHAADESDWQKLVLDYLGVQQHVIQVDEELGLLEDMSCRALRRHGVLSPANSYIHLPLMRESSGGTLLTGAGGDELFAHSIPGGAALLLAGQKHPTPRDVAALAAGLFAPQALVRRFRRRKETLPLPWLRPQATRTALKRWYADEPPEHAGYAAELEPFYESRYVASLLAASSALSSDHACRTLHPFLEGRVVAALAAVGGRRGLGGRTCAMQLLVGDLLPAKLIARQSKANLGDAVWTAGTLRYLRCASAVEALDEYEVLGHLIDRDILRREWQGEQPHFASATLAQLSWLAARGGPDPVK